MKTILTLIVIVLAAGCLDFYFKNEKLKDNLAESRAVINSLQEDIDMRKEDFSEFRKILAAKDNHINSLEAQLEAPEVIEEEVSVNFIDRPKILSELNKLEQERGAVKKEYSEKIGQIDGFIQKGMALRLEEQGRDPNFNNGSIRTSDADRERWYAQQRERILHYDRELEKLEGRKEVYRRELNGKISQIELQESILKNKLK